ncbi:MAG: UDP-glucose 4-epimerase GalE [Terriglobales bacterium]
MRVLVTGGAGYVGSHAARELVRRGHDVLIYDNLSTGHRSLTNGFELIVADIGDRKELASALRGADAVIHFAARACAGESMMAPRQYFQTNVQHALSMLDTVLDSGVRTFIFSSTCAVYGVPAIVPICEDIPREPINPYGASKLFFEHALEAYSRAYGLRFVSLRYFNAAGADESCETGELHFPETHLIPIALQAAAGIRSDIEIFGDDYPTRDGTCVRDYVHVSDLAEAHALALHYLDSGGDSTALNLGTGSGYSVNEVLAVVEKVTQRELPKRRGPRRVGDPPMLVAAPSRAQRLLQWRASRSLEQMVQSAWNWMQACCRGGDRGPRGGESAQ